MKKWYNSPAAKGIMLVTAIVSAMVAAVSLVFVLSFSGMQAGNGSIGFSVKDYRESEDMQELMYDVSSSILEELHYKDLFERDGKYDPEMIVDVIEYVEEGTISGENNSGLAYKLGDLEKWGEKINAGYDGYKERAIVVCKKPDGTYYYYDMDEFKSLIENGKLVLELEYEGREQFLDELQSGYYEGDGNGNLSLKDDAGNLLYTECWTFDRILEEEAAPQGAENLLEVMNTVPELNGRLTDVYSYLSEATRDIASKVRYFQDNDAWWSEGNTNFTFVLADLDKKIVRTNNSDMEKFDRLDKNIEALSEKENYKYVIVKPKLAEFESNMDVAAGEWRSMVENWGEKEDNYLFAAAVDTDFPIQDIFHTNAENYNKYAPYLNRAMVFLLLFGMLLCISLVWLTVTAGRKQGDEELHLNSFDGWKTEPAAALIILIWLFITYITVNGWHGFGVQFEEVQLGLYHGIYAGYTQINVTQTDIMILAVYAGVSMLLFLSGYLSLVRRIKAKTVWSNSLLHLIIRGCMEFWKNRTILWKTVLPLAGVILIHWFVIFSYSRRGWMILLMIASEITVVYFVLRSVVMKGKVTKGIQEIASGNVGYQIPLEGLRGESIEMAEKINDIGNGMKRAVDEGLRSERLKTDLITNVSHDIKTPLTSIINYVDLLKRENIEDPKIQGYLEVLEAKAQRLKTLTEDVVEASKVSSGNITLEYMDVDLVEMLNQTIGEFSEKFAARDLTIVAKLPGEPAVIHVDGRRMWRVLENVFNNAAKYAMPGTRVYADLQHAGPDFVFSLKNISEQPLNISADELTERFIRGDLSRSTEGSGLGLSIARSLTEMQGGRFQLYLDGDLFKVTITFTKKK